MLNLKNNNMFATPKNTKIGEIVGVPLNNESGHDEQFCLDYEVVLALRTKIKPEEQVVGVGQEPLPEYLPFTNEIAYKK